MFRLYKQLQLHSEQKEALAARWRSWKVRRASLARKFAAAHAALQQQLPYADIRSLMHAVSVLAPDTPVATSGHPAGTSTRTPLAPDHSTLRTGDGEQDEEEEIQAEMLHESHVQLRVETQLTVKRDIGLAYALPAFAKDTMHAAPVVDDVAEREAAKRRGSWEGPMLLGESGEVISAVAV